MKGISRDYYLPNKRLEQRKILCALFFKLENVILYREIQKEKLS